MSESIFCLLQTVAYLPLTGKQAGRTKDSTEDNWKAMRAGHHCSLTVIRRTSPPSSPISRLTTVGMHCRLMSSMLADSWNGSKEKRTKCIASCGNVEEKVPEDKSVFTTAGIGHSISCKSREF